MSSECILSQRGSKFSNCDLCVDIEHQGNTHPEGVINLGTSENKLMYDVLKPKFQESASYDIKEHHTHYCDFRGVPEFRETIAEFFDYYMQPAEPVDPDNLIALNGCAAVVEALGAVLADPGEGILIPSPYYGGFIADLSQRSQVVPFPVHLSSEPGPEENSPFELSTWRLEKAMKEAKLQGVTIRALLLCNPNNPLGIIYTEQQLQDYLDFAHRHSLHIILDEIYMLSIFKKGQTMKSILSFTNIPDKQRLHVIWGFSKDFGVSGFRCGVLHTWNRDVFNSLRWIAYFQSVSTPTQVLLMNLIKDKNWIDHVFIPTNHKRLLECHSIVCDGLKRAGIPYVESYAGLFIWADFRELLSSKTFEEEIVIYKKLLEHKVYINPGQSFDYNEPGWFRLVFATDPHQLRIGIERVVSCVNQLREEATDKKQQLNEIGTSCHGDNDTSSDVFLQDGATDPGASLEDLARLLCSNIRNSDWLQVNTAEKWTQENPELAKAFLENRDKGE